MVQQWITDHRDVNDRPGPADGNTFTFDYWHISGKIKSWTDCDGYTVNYDYSLAYNQTTEVNVIDPNGELIYDVNYVYDRAGRLTDVCEPMLGIDQNLIAGFEYDDNGNRSRLKYFLDGRGENGDGRATHLPCRQRLCCFRLIRLPLIGIINNLSHISVRVTGLENVRISHHF